MRRRGFLAASVATTASLAGCQSYFETRAARSPPLVEDRPDAVYVPSHVEGMEMVAAKAAGDFRVALTYSFPHRFWPVNGDRRNAVDIRDGDSVHLMVTVWDPETGTVVPNSSVSATITRGGDRVGKKRLWPMLSQNMGVHAGDNFALDGDGTYEVDLEVGAIQARTTGAFRDQFSAARAAFTLEFERATLDEISFERLPDRQGNQGAVRPMEMGKLPVASAPDPDALPGRTLGTPTTGDAVLATTTLDSPPAGVEGEAYLAVSMRTRYNSYPLPFTSLSATATRDGETRFAGTLQPTFDPDLGYHYGAAVPPVEAGDDLTLSVDVPPQIARHEGYETAFFEFDDVSLTA